MPEEHLSKMKDDKKIIRSRTTQTEGLRRTGSEQANGM
jgi:hypothetical protein